VTSQDDVDLAQRDAGDDVLEAFAAGDCRPALAQIVIDHLDVDLLPTQINSPLPLCILQPQTFLVGPHWLVLTCCAVDCRI
jgi:hypothetical protein